MSTGDRVRFADSQRADKPALEAMQTLGRDALMVSLGGLLGPAGAGVVERIRSRGGCLTPLTVNNLNPAAVELGACLLLEVDETDPAQPRSRVLRHDPTLEGQTSTVDTTPYQAGEGTPWLWARRMEVATSLDTRKRWFAGAEQSFPHQTRIAERVEFRLTADGTAPADPGPWTPVAQVTGWTSGKPAFTGQPALDFFRGDPLYGQVITEAEHTAADLMPFYLFGQPLGLVNLLFWLRYQVARILDMSHETHWLGSPVRGLKQIETALTAHDLVDQGLSNMVADLQDAAAETTAALERQIGAAAAIYWNAGNYSWGADVESITRTGAGVIEVELRNPGFAATLLGVQVQEIANPPDVLGGPVITTVEILNGNVQLAVKHVRITIRDYTDGVPTDNSVFITAIYRRD